MFKKCILILSVLAVGSFVNAQEPVVQQVVEDMLESKGEDLSDDTDIQEILDDLENFRQNPLEINRATRTDLTHLHLLS